MRATRSPADLAALCAGRWPGARWLGPAGCSGCAADDGPVRRAAKICRLPSGGSRIVGGVALSCESRGLSSVLGRLTGRPRRPQRSWRGPAPRTRSTAPPEGEARCQPLPPDIPMARNILRTLTKQRARLDFGRPQNDCGAPERESGPNNYRTSGPKGRLEKLEHLPARASVRRAGHLWLAPAPAPRVGDQLKHHSRPLRTGHSSRPAGRPLAAAHFLHVPSRAAGGPL